MSASKYQVLARRYRPKTFGEVVGQEPIVTTLKNALRFDRTAHAYLFCGSRGIGKTTLARLFAKALNCQNRQEDLEPCNKCPSCLEISAGQSLDVIEIDGASNRGIDDVRQITETACYSPSQGSYKIYIIDEVHMLTKEAFNALLKTLEEPPEKAKFLFATTEPHKMLPTIISRCQRFDLGRIQNSQIIRKLEQIASDLNKSLEAEAAHLIAAFADGSLRDAESMLDQILCFAGDIVTADAVRSSLGLVSNEQFFALDLAFSSAKSSFAFELVELLFNAGKDLGHFLEQLIEHVRYLTLARLSGEPGLHLPPDLSARYLQSARLYAPSQCLYLLEYLLRMEQLVQKSPCQRVALEAVLLHYIQSKNRIPVEVLVRRLSELEQHLGRVSANARDFDFISKEETPSIQKAERQTPILQEKIERPCSDIKEVSSPRQNEKKLPSNENAFQSPACQREATLRLPKEDDAAPHALFPNLNTSSDPLLTPQTSPSSPALKRDCVPDLKTQTASPSHTRSDNTQPTPQPIKPKSSPLLKNTPFSPYPSRNEAPLSPNEGPPPPSVESIAKKDPWHYDTLMRFSAVELEGTLKLN